MLEAGTISPNDRFLVIGRNTGADYLTLDELVVNGDKGSQATKGDKITFPFDRPLRANDKLYKVIEDHG